MPKSQKEADELKEVQSFLQEVDGAEKPDFEYLCDSGTEFEGLKIWGSPWTPVFFNWHFMKKRGEEIKKQWDLIPDDIDILITHGPPFGILDVSGLSSRRKPGGFHCGCKDLTQTLERLTKLKLHVFGHIHDGYGKMAIGHKGREFTCVNASIMDEDYNPVNKPIRVVL
jgi:Icc-related predicted phosphoesterase